MSAAQWSSKPERELVHLRAALYLSRAVCQLAALVPVEPCLLSVVRACLVHLPAAL